MNYWHIQLHPDKRLSSTTIKQILTSKKVIGLGSYWEDRNGNEVADPDWFQNHMKPGDIVMVRDGSSPIALVEVNGSSYFEQNTIENFDWFDLRRPIEVLGIYEESDREILNQILKNYILK